MYRRLKNLDAVRDLIRESAKLEDVARSMYGVELRASGQDDMKGKCPFHREDTPSFGIRKSKQLYHCFGCKASGDVFKFVEMMDSCEHMEAVRKLAEFATVDLSPFMEAYTDQERAQQELYNLNADVKDFALSQGSTLITAWAKQRKMNMDILVGQYEVGYTFALRPEDIPAADLQQAMSLQFTEEGKWQNRMCIPLKDHFGRIAGFRNKDIEGVSKIKMLGPHQNHALPAPELYGLYEARRYIRNAGFLILVEGEPDVWQMAAHGYRNTAAMMGTKLTESALATIDSLSIPLVIVMADNDEAGRKFSAKLAETKHNCKALIKIATLTGEAKDPDEALLAYGADRIGATLAEAKYAFEYHIERKLEKYDITRQTEKLDALTELRPYFVDSAPIVRELGGRLLARGLTLDYETVIDFFREAESDAKADLHNVAAERGVLKRILTDPEFVGEALLSLRADDFYLSKHRSVYEAVGKLYRTQQAVNESTVRTFVENRTGESAAGLLSGILHTNVLCDGANYLLADLRDKALRRSIQKRAREVATRLSDTSADAKQIIQALSADISTAVSGGGSRMVEVGEIVQERMNLMHQRIRNPNAIVGLDLGRDFPILNHTLHGLQRGRYIVVSAPAGTGKTAFAGVIAKIAAIDNNEPTLYFTYETGTETLTDRIISNISGVESDKIVTGYISKEEAEGVHDAAALVASSPLILTERGMVFEECAAMMRHDVLKRGTRLVIVDYIQLMTMAGADARLRRDQELGQISRGFLELAKDLDITLLVLAQHNRESAKSGSNEKEGIGESYKIAQDVDAMLVFREKTSEEMQADGPEKGNRVMKLAKHRHGKGGVQFNLLADLDVMRIREATGRAVIS